MSETEMEGQSLLVVLQDEGHRRHRLSGVEIHDPDASRIVALRGDVRGRASES